MQVGLRVHNAIERGEYPLPPDYNGVEQHVSPLSVIACAVVGERDPFPVLDLSTYTWGGQIEEKLK
jgi:hypothetical protein